MVTVLQEKATGQVIAIYQGPTIDDHKGESYGSSGIMVFDRDFMTAHGWKVSDPREVSVDDKTKVIYLSAVPP